MGKTRDRIARYIADYLDARLVFCMDLVISVSASFFVYATLHLLTGTEMFHGVGIARIFLSSCIATIIALVCTKSYRLVIRHSSITDILRYLGTALIKQAGILASILLLDGYHSNVPVALVSDFVITLAALLGARLVMIITYDVFQKKYRDRFIRRRILVYGTSDKSVSAITRLKDSPHFAVIGFISPEPVAKGYLLSEHKVFYFKSQEDFKTFANDISLGGVLFCTEEDAQSEQNGIITFCASSGIKVLFAPGISEMTSGRMVNRTVRNIQIEDLLGRPEINISMDDITRNFNNKVVMVTGAAGSIGSELCRQLAGLGVSKLVLYDNAETPMHNLRLELEERFPHLSFEPIIGDVRHERRLDLAFEKYHPQIVFHAAAYKHVPLMEENPCEAVRVNVIGSRLVADKCLQYGVHMMVMISTDKAVNPTNVMGCTKRLAEIYTQSLGLAVESGQKKGTTKFVTTRFGNVLGSNGSVIPRFRAQIEKGGPVTVTDPRITRFFMTIPEACRLVMEAATMSEGNQIFVFDMGESVKIDHLARRMIELAGFRPDIDIAIEYTGLRPGEKLYEEVLSNKENTLPTQHERIRMAQVREYPYEDAVKAVEKLDELSINVEIPEMVRYMKEIVPEFISRNSVFEKFDKQQ